MKVTRKIQALAFGVAAAAVVGAASAQAECKLNVVAEMPLEMDGNRPLIQGAINGTPILALADTGSFNTMLWRGSAERMGLDLKPIRGLQLTGVGGTHNAQAALVKDLKLGDTSRKNVDLLVGGRGGLHGAHEIAMILGQDIFSKFDVEIDLAHSMIRLLNPTDCKKDSLAYWSQDYGVAKLNPMSDYDRSIKVDVLVNGKTVRAVMDTGAYTSVISTQAAIRAGVRPGAEGIESDGRIGGIGGKSVESWVANFDSFSFGDETIRNAKLRVADMFRHSREADTSTRIKTDRSETEMLLGADFFRAHRILISYSQGKAYFTHNGGAVFQTVGPVRDEGDQDVAPATNPR